MRILRILITGAAGFVGEYCIEYFKNVQKYEVYAGKLPQEKQTVPCNWIDFDIIDKENLKQKISEIKPDYILHLAAQSSVSKSWENPQNTANINIIGTMNLLEAVKNEGISPVIILAGSAEEYGKAVGDVPVNEDFSCIPQNFYAASKLCQNNIGRIYSNAYGMKIIMTRAFNHIGPGQSTIFVASDFARQIAEIEYGLREPIIKTGNISAARDFLDVRDVVTAYAALFEKGKYGETYNIGSGQAIRISKILEILLSFSNIDIKHVIDKEKLRPIDTPRICADISKIKIDTGWKPERDIYSTLKNTLDYQRNQVGKEIK